MEANEYIAVCERCSKAVRIRRKDASVIGGPALSKTDRVKLHFRRQQRSEILKELLDGVEHENDIIRSLFPACPACIRNSFNQIKLMTKNCECAIKTLDVVADIPSEILEGEIEQRVNSTKEQPKPARLRGPINIKELDETIDRAVNLYLELPDIPIPRIKLCLFHTFHIGCSGHYATINNARVGFFRYHKNSLYECNAGLQMLIHLVWTMCRSFDIHSKIKVFPTGEVERQGKRCKLEISMTMDQKAVNAFNFGLTGLFQICSELFIDPNAMSFCSMPPKLIDIEHGMIEKIPFAFSVKNTEPWSLAMRNLMFNLKIQQGRMKDRFVQCNK